jgi:hypothetical protein
MDDPTQVALFVLIALVAFSALAFVVLMYLWANAPSG